MTTAEAPEATRRLVPPDVCQIRRQLRGLSHDFGATVMMLRSSFNRLKEMLQSPDTVPPDGIHAQLRQVEACVNQSHSHMDDLVRLATEGQMDLRAEVLEVGPVVDELLLEHAPLIRQRAAEAKVWPGLPMVWCNRARLKDVLSNLVRNALRHGCDGVRPRIEIGPCATPGSDPMLAAIRVWDNGPGIDPRRAREIFLPGRQLAGSGVGTGWGLAIARSAVEAFGGRLDLDAECPEGTAFRLVLPRAEPLTFGRGEEPVEPGREWTLQLDREHRVGPLPHTHPAHRV